MSQTPEILFSQITDPVIRDNFKKIKDFFTTQSRFLGFQFFTLTFTKAEANVKFAHNLGFLPLDVILTSKIGVGSVTFNQDLTTQTELDISVTDACEIRFLAGSFQKGL